MCIILRCVIPVVCSEGGTDVYIEGGTDVYIEGGTDV